MHAAIIDVEGSEIQVLQGMNPCEVPPAGDVTLVQTELTRFMSDRPDYRQVGTLGCNRIFMHADEAEALARVAATCEMNLLAT